MVIKKTSGKKFPKEPKQTWEGVKKDIDVAYHNWLKKQILPRD